MRNFLSLGVNPAIVNWHSGDLVQFLHASSSYKIFVIPFFKKLNFWTIIMRNHIIQFGACLQSHSHEN